MTSRHPLFTRDIFNLLLVTHVHGSDIECPGGLSDAMSSSSPLLFSAKGRPISRGIFGRSFHPPHSTVCTSMLDGSSGEIFRFVFLDLKKYRASLYMGFETLLEKRDLYVHFYM